MGYMRLESPYLYHKKGKGKEGNRERKEKKESKRKGIHSNLTMGGGVVGGRG